MTFLRKNLKKKNIEIATDELEKKGKKKKIIISSSGVVFVSAIIILFAIFNPFGKNKEKLIEPENDTTVSETQETVKPIEDIGISDSIEAEFEKNGSTYYADALGASIAIEESAIQAGTKLSVKKYNIDESPVADVIKNNGTISNIFSLYNFELLKDDKVVTLGEGYNITATFKVPDDASKFIALCYINYENNSLEFYKGNIKDGYISFNLNHFSFYSLVEMTEDNYYAQFGLPVVEQKAVVRNDMGATGTVSTETPVIVEPSVFEVTGMVFGIDVSRWQGTINWNAVKASGIKFVMIKACGLEYGEEGIYVDKNFTKNIEGALAAGLQVGVYAFSDVITETDTINLANKVTELVKGYKITYPIVFDFEGSSLTPAVSKTDLTNLAIKFCDIVKGAGYTPMVYANTNYFKNKYNVSDLSSKYKIWLAIYYQPQYYGETYDGHWYASDIYPQVNYPFQMWQYTSQGRVNGISGNVDLSVAFFSYSGTSVSTSALELTVSKTDIVTNINSTPNLLEGITARNTIGIDVSNQVTYTLTNSGGQTVTGTEALKTAGNYTIQYTVVDFTGGKLSKTANLRVRALPTLNGTQVSYSALTTNTIAEIYSQITSGVSAVNKNNDGNTVSYGCVVVNSIGNEVINASNSTSLESLPEGIYTVKYTVKDTSGTYPELQKVDEVTLTVE